jgi:Flp pilus assembly protein TadG
MRGQGLVELALILPVFLLLIMILFDFGRVIYAQNAISNDAREGGRVAIVDASYGSQKYADIRAAAKRFSPLVSLTDANITGRPGVPCPDVADAYPGCFYPDAAAAGHETEVNIQVTVPIITPIISQLIGGSFTLTAKSVNFIQCSGC